MSVEIIRDTINTFLSRRDLSGNVTEQFFDALLSETDESLLVDLFSAWSEKGINENEIFDLAQILRSRMKRITSRHEAFIDAVGTGGSSAKTFNVSTAAAFVIAGAGVPVAKHGNRAASSKSGSADVLSELGVRVDVEPIIAEQCLNEIGICFMFAPKFHSLSLPLASARRRFSRPTIFNCLGPLCNPASAPYQLIGAWDKDVARSIANALARFGTKRSWVVHGSDGLDELTLSGTSTVFDVCCDNAREIEITPEDFGFTRCQSRDISKVGNAIESADIVKGVVGNSLVGGKAEDLVVINAAAGIYLTGRVDSLAEAAITARESIRSGRAQNKLSELGAATNR
jgi:anthranilate phosphoribosyltransferase